MKALNEKNFELEHALEIQKEIRISKYRISISIQLPSNKITGEFLKFKLFAKNKFKDFYLDIRKRII